MLRMAGLPAVAVLVAATASFGQNSPPLVENVTAQQVPGTGLVTITYDVSDAENDNVHVRLICSADGGVTFSLQPRTVSGHVNTTIPPGPGKSIIWDAAADFPGIYLPQVVAKVIATDGVALVGEMVMVPAGSFVMGHATLGSTNNRPAHTVSLDAFLIDKYEVSNAEYEQFISAGGYSTSAYWSAEGWDWREATNVQMPSHWDLEGGYGAAYPGFPVRGVSYYEAEAYATFVGKRLPTEAEWEKAARGSDERLYSWGSQLSPQRANYNNSLDPYEGTTWTTPVGFYDGRLHPEPLFQTLDSPSPYGAYDMSGNVLEWVRDWFDASYYSSIPSANPTGPLTGTSRVRRGGAYISDAPYAFVRSPDGPESRYVYAGFRCARSQ